MLEVPKTWKEVFIQSKVCLALLLENISLICSESHTSTKPLSKRRDTWTRCSLYSLNLKQDYKA